MLKLWNKTI